VVKRTGPTNPILKQLIQDLKEKSYELNSNFIKDLADKLNKPRRQRIEVNLSHIERHTEKNDEIVVPGVVLGFGELTKPLKISAWRFSNPAKEKIEGSGGKFMSIRDLMEKNPEGSKVKIIC